MTKYLVTGGGGFVGSALVRSLLIEGHDVISLARRDYPDLKKAGAQTVQIDLTGQCNSLSQHFVGVEAVFHVAAKVDMWGKREDFFAGNVIATRNVIECCERNGVRRLIFTSSPSVVADGSDLKGIDETFPYSTHYESLYAETKAQSEREVLAKHTDTLRTIALRPHLIFGPGDTNLIPTIVSKAKAGRLLQIGDGHNLSDFTYIDDCVMAHRRADQALAIRMDVGGKAYFISQGDPVPLWEFINRVLAIYSILRVTRKIPTWLAKLLAGGMEVAANVFPFEPLITKFLVSEMTTSHYFDISAARNDLGYQPTLSVWEGLARIEEELRG